MNQSKINTIKQTIKTICICFLILILISAVYLVFIRPFVHARFLTQRLNNPFVNARYVDWKDIEVDDKIKIKVPQDWTIECGDRITLLDKSGKVKAEGIRETDIYADPAGIMIMESMEKEGIIIDRYSTRDFRTSYVSNFWNSGYSALRTTVFDDGTSCEDVFADLSYSRFENGSKTDFYYYMFVFSADTEEEKKEAFNIAEAIAWSMTYSDKPVNPWISRCLNLS